MSPSIHILIMHVTQAWREAMVGREVKSVHRRGKQLWWELSDEGQHPLFHFGMTGSFSVKVTLSV